MMPDIITEEGRTTRTERRTVKKTRLNLLAILGASVFAAVHCNNPETSHQIEAPSKKYPLLFQSVGAHDNCVKDENLSGCKFPYDGPIAGFKCLTTEKQPRIYVTEVNQERLRLWYETKLRRDISQEKFEEYCSSTLENYVWFRGTKTRY